MRKWLAFLALLPFLVLLYLLYTGSYSWFEALLGFLASLVISYLFAAALIEHPSRLYNPARYFWLFVYMVLYLTWIEAKAHLGVIKLIFSPSKVNPAIVRIPYRVRSDYAVTLIANSITNTPGTVVVDVDEERRNMYVHWIRATALEDEKARKEVSALFERYSRKIFEGGE